jgi:quercetin dioxygenase-like cupin family protein
MIKKLVLCAVVAATAAVCVPAVAQQPEPLKRTVLQKTDIPGDKSTVLVLIEIAPNFVVGKHTHPGIETGYVMDGEVLLTLDGQGEKAVKAGESYLTPAAVPHIVKGGPQGVKLIATFVVDKDKPLASPAP